MVTASSPVRGQVWEYVQGSRQYRVLVVSSDEYNVLSDAMPWALVVERGAPRTPGHLVELSSTDPLPGAVVVIPLVVRCDTTALRRNLGYVGNDTLNAVEGALRELLTLA